MSGTHLAMGWDPVYGTRRIDGTTHLRTLPRRPGGSRASCLTRGPGPRCRCTPRTAPAPHKALGGAVREAAVREEVREHVVANIAPELPQHARLVRVPRLGTRGRRGGASGRRGRTRALETHHALLPLRVEVQGEEVGQLPEADHVDVTRRHLHCSASCTSSRRCGCTLQIVRWRGCRCFRLPA